MLKPRSLLPFKVEEQRAQEHFQAWIKGRWFAPSALKRRALNPRGLKGIYVPYWTFDSNTTSFFSGERGIDHQVRETYTEREGEETLEKTRTVTKTRWEPAGGVVWKSFDDVLVLASTSLPKRYTDALEPWDLENLIPYDASFLSGFITERYQVSLEEGFEQAKDAMGRRIDEAARHDIGGDHQRVRHVRTRHSNVTFKHVLLPIWGNAYRHGGKTYLFVINGRTGEVQGERPYSMAKIAMTVAAVAATVLLWQHL